MDSNLWKNKDELKKFLENLGIEYRYGCFEENNPDTCHLLGDYLLSIDKARAKAAQVYKNNCDSNNFGLSCDAYGRMAFKGQGMEGPNLKLAHKYFLRGCDLNEPRACYHAGQLMGVVDKKVNAVITPDPKKSAECLTKACMSRKLPASCTLIHSFYLKGHHGQPPDLKLAADFAKMGCDQDDYMSCYNLARMYHIGDGVDADQATSMYYHKRAKEIKDGYVRQLQANKEAKPDL